MSAICRGFFVSQRFLIVVDWGMECNGSFDPTLPFIWQRWKIRTCIENTPAKIDKRCAPRVTYRPMDRRA